jgi:hypothetical protein
MEEVLCRHLHSSARVPVPHVGYASSSGKRCRSYQGRPQVRTIGKITRALGIESKDLLA